MSSPGRSLIGVVSSLALIVFNVGWDMIGYQNPTFGYVLWGVSAVLFLIAAWPYLRRVRVSLVPTKSDPQQLEDAASQTTSHAAAIHTGSIGSIGRVENLHMVVSRQEDEAYEDFDASDEPDYETRTHFEDEGVYLPLFTLDDLYVRGKTFVNCRIYGPAIVTPVVPSDFDSTFSDCAVDADDPSEWLWPVHEERSSYMGVIGLERCFFEGCTFYRVGIVIKERFYERSLRQLRGEQARLEEASKEPTEEESTSS